MIISGKPQRHEKPWRLVMYRTDPDGKCVPDYKVTEFDDLIHEYYTQRTLELERLQQLLSSQEISPVHFFMEYHHMSVRDVASRMNLRLSVVKKHLTPQGFEKVDVATLKRYARIFDIGVSDFFQFLFVPPEVGISVEQRSERLLQHVVITVANE